jgi:hypothetical protein
MYFGVSHTNFRENLHIPYSKPSVSFIFYDSTNVPYIIDVYKKMVLSREYISFPRRWCEMHRNMWEKYGI